MTHHSKKHEQAQDTNGGGKADKKAAGANEGDKGHQQLKKGKTGHNEHKESISDLTCTLQRVQAEFENYRKRVDRDLASMMKFACCDTVTRFLPVIDNFDRAMAHSGPSEEFINGIKLIHGQLHEVLDSLGIRKIETEGQQFDPEFHEALMQACSDRPKGAILEVLQSGYALGDRVLRHARVKISSGPKAPEPKTQDSKPNTQQPDNEDNKEHSQGDSA